MTRQTSVRALAFHLPQFHPIPENDLWWGKGFTEWTNVVQSRPRFAGHYQPHLPADLGFYDLRLAEARQAQASLAREYGIEGFCYYHYWFNGRRLLERPLDEILSRGEPDLPFCLCWANENWTRQWDGCEHEVLVRQKYSAEDDIAHFRWLCRSFADPRYIHVDGRPLFLVYRVEDLPDPAQTAQRWRREAQKAGIPDPYLVYVENLRDGRAHPRRLLPESIHFDASVGFAPCFDGLTPQESLRMKLARRLHALRLMSPPQRSHKTFSYEQLAQTMSERSDPPYKRFHCVAPGWDNSSRRAKGATVFVGSTPEIYERWLRTVVARTRSSFAGDEALVFVNAWNEWAEGAHLEPCLKWGHQYLEMTRRALQR